MSIGQIKISLYTIQISIRIHKFLLEIYYDSKYIIRNTYEKFIIRNINFS